RALARAALAGRRQSGPELPGLALRFAGRGVASRVEALLAAPPTTRLMPLVAPIAMVLFVAVATVEASRDLEALFEFAQRLWTG
ncbi:MAG: M56 family peptidase, partial [Actinomycetota bacterium]|nr:M56 family peptidase [Actinomycetota bacterium]